MGPGMLRSPLYWLMADASWVKVAASALWVPCSCGDHVSPCGGGLPSEMRLAPHYASGTHTLHKPPALQRLTSVHCYVRLNNSQHLALKLAHCRQSN